MSGRAPGGRRIRVDPDRVPVRGEDRSVLLVIAVLVVAGGLLTAAGMRSSTPAETVERPRTSPISVLAQACPVPEPGTRARGTWIGTGTVRLDGAAPVSGEGSPAKAVATALPGGASVNGLEVSSRGDWLQQAAGNKARAVLLTSSGSLAPGHVAFSATRAGPGLGGGLAVSSCATSADESWFVGADSSAEEQSRLVLTNLSESPAVARVRLFGATGPLDAVRANGIVVAPSSTKVIRVEDLVAGEQDVALNVSVLRGALATAVFAASTTAGARGSDWIGPAAPPSTTQVVPAVVPRTTGRTLLVTNPGDRTASATVTVAGADGPFTAKGLDRIRVKPQSVAAVDIPSSVGAKVAALTVTSDVPVTASVLQSSRGPASDSAVASAGVPLTATGVLPLEVGGSLADPRVTLVLSSLPDAPQTSVRVTARDRSGRARGMTTVTVRPESTVTLDPAKDKELDLPAKISYLTVDAADAGVLVAGIYQSPAGVAVLGVADAPATVEAPAVTSAG